MELYEAALKIATGAHDGQKRNGGEPYIVHPVATATLFLTQKMPDTVIAAAAVLHDTIEDTDLTEAAIVVQLTEKCPNSPRSSIELIGRVVSLLTRPQDMPYAKYISQMRNLSHYAMPHYQEILMANAIKKSDLKDNLKDHPPGARRDKYELALALLETS